MRTTFGDSLSDLAVKQRQDWVLLWPGQIVIAGSQTYWTAGVEEGLRTGTLPRFFQVMLKNVSFFNILLPSNT